MVATLGRVQGALSGRELVPILSCFCFDGKTVTAYDDTVALRFPIETAFKGGLRGRLILDFLGASRAKEVEVTEDGENKVLLKAGRSKLEMPLLPESDFLFSPPDTKKGQELIIEPVFITALTQAAISLGLDPTHVWRLGITAHFEGSTVTLYSSDNKTATRVVCKLSKKGPEDLVVLFPPPFVERFLDIKKTDKPTRIFVAKDWIEARFSSGLKLFSKAISGADTKQFQEVFSSVMKQATALAEIPKGLDKCLQRAMAVIPYAKEPYTRLKVKEDRLSLFTESAAGDHKDSISVTHPSVDAAMVAPDLIIRSLSLATHFQILDQAVVLKNGKAFTHLVTVVTQLGQSDGE